MKYHYTKIIRINLFVVINQTNKHKAKIYNHCMYTQIIIIIIIKNFIITKKKFHPANIKKTFCFAKYKNDKFIIK